jgi:hypothetical protein
MRNIYDTHGRPLRVERSAEGRRLTLQPTVSSTRHLDRAGVRALLDVIASSPVLRNEMRKALAVYAIGDARRRAPRPAPRADELRM